MRSRLLFLFAVLFCTGVLRAQPPIVYGTANEYEVILDTRYNQFDGSTINVGYIYVNGNTAASDCYVNKVDAAGLIVWERRMGTPLEDKFFRLDIGADDNLYIVGWTQGQVAGSTNNTFKALICRLDQNGNTIWWRELLEVNPSVNGVGPKFFGVRVLANGNIAAVGSVRSVPGVVDGLMAVLTSAGGVVWSNEYPYTASNLYYNVIQHPTSGRLVACGVIDVTGAKYDGLITIVDANSGVQFNSRRYPSAVTYNNINLTFLTFFDIHVRGTGIFVDGLITNDYVASQGDNTIALEIAPVTGNGNGFCISNPPNNYSNYGKVYPLGGAEYLLTQHPGAANFNFIAMGQPSNYVLTHINAETIVEVETPDMAHQAGERVLFGLDVNNTDIHTAGFIRDAQLAAPPQQIGQDDMFRHNNTLPFTETLCPTVRDSVVSDSIQIVPVAVTIKDVTAFVADEPEAVNIDVQSDTLGCVTDTIPVPPCDTCDTSGRCPDECYWTLEGNNITMPKNIFGTLTTHDIRIVTDNQQRAVIQANGYMGIGVTPSTTTLHVDCTIPVTTSPPSGLRFENLPQGDGQALVVDANGYVLKAQSHLYKQSLDDVQNEVKALKQQVEELKRLINGTGTVDNSYQLSVSPNPTNGEFEAVYAVPASFKNAQVRLTDNSGKLIALKDIPANNSAGMIRMSIPKTIASGQLICTLICDGAAVASQKIVFIAK